MNDIAELYDAECAADTQRITDAQIAMINGGMAYRDTLPIVNELLTEASERFIKRRYGRVARILAVVCDWWGRS